MFLKLAVQDDTFCAGIRFWLLLIIIINFIQLFPRMKLGNKMFFYAYKSSPKLLQDPVSLHYGVGVRDMAR